MDKLTGADYLGIGTPTLAETGIVLTSRMGHLSNSLLVGLLQELGINEIPFWSGSLEGGRGCLSAFRPRAASGQTEFWWTA